MPIVVSYNDLGLLGGLAVQAGQAQGEIKDKEYFRQRQMRDESMLLQNSLNKPGGMPAAQFGAQPAPRPGGTAGTVMDAANQQARIIQKPQVAPIGGSVNLGQQELAKNMAKETARIEADKQELKARQDEIKQMVDSGVINQSRGDELINAYYNERYGFNPKDQTGGGGGGGAEVKPINAEEQIGYAIGQTRQWDQLNQVNKENLASGFRSTKSATGKNTSVLAGVEKYFQSLPTDEFFKMWADGEYPPELVDFMDQEYQRRLDSGRAHLGPGEEHGVPGGAFGQNGQLGTGLQSMSDQELMNEAAKLLMQQGR